jgi:sugar lactone lactonase YvrE
MTKKYQVTPIFNEFSEHGEGPLWDEVTQKLYWVDILRGDYYKADSTSLVVEKYIIGQPLGVLALREKGGLIMAVRDGFGFFDEVNSNFELIRPSPEEYTKEVRFNDGAVDPYGRFIAGTMEWNGEKEIGKLFQINQDHQIRELDDHFFIPNGMGWNDEMNIYFVIDTFKHAIFAYDYEIESGNISNKRIHIKFGEDEFPDGMTIDSEGGFWVAIWGGSKLVRFDSIGNRIDEIWLPVLHPTSCCFGGSDMKTLFITTSKIALSSEQEKKYPLAGSIFKIETDIIGRFETKYKG